MAIENMIAGGVGFNPGSVRFMVTMGLRSLDPTVPERTIFGGTSALRRTSVDSSVLRQTNRETILR